MCTKCHTEANVQKAEDAKRKAEAAINNAKKVVDEALADFVEEGNRIKETINDEVKEAERRTKKNSTKLRRNLDGSSTKLRSR